MAYKPALDDGEVQQINLRAIRDWIKSNKGKIKAKPNKTILYAGRDYDLEVVDDLPLEDRKEFMGTPMWKRIKELRKNLSDLKLPAEFETLEDVLQKIADHPTLITRDRQELSFSNAFEFFNELEEYPKLYPDVKRVSRESWESLSEAFAGNAEGDIKIMDGAADDYAKLGKDKILIRKELEALLKNDKLSRKAKEVLSKKMSKYGDFFDRRYTQLLKQLEENRACLKGKK